MFSFLHTWQMQGGNTPFSFRDLAKHSQVAEQVQDYVRQILGLTWDMFFRRPSNTDILPRQAVVFVLHGLTQLRTNYETVAGDRQAHAAALEAMRAQRKRRRTQPAGGASGSDA